MGVSGRLQISDLVRQTSSIGPVGTAFVRERIKAREGKEALANLVPNRLMPPTAIADAYWQIYHQPRSAWVFEQEIRPFGESGEGARGPFKVGEAQEERLWLVP